MGTELLQSRFTPLADRSWPRVSVIIVCWNRLFDVLLSLKKLALVDYPDLEILVVDNGSDAATVSALEQQPGITLIQLPENRGPCVARNVAIDQASGEYVLLLDSDATLDPKSLRSVVRQMQADKRIGIAGFKVLDAQAKALDQWIYAQPPETHADQSFDTYSFSAAGALLRTEALRQAGGFWESLFIYNEEVELSLRVLRAGYRVIYTPRGRVFHRASGEGRASQSNYFRLQIRNWIWIFRRHFPRPMSWWKIGMYSAVYLVKGATNRNLFACTRGIAEGILSRPTDMAAQPRMAFDNYRQFEALNRRTHVRLWNLATVGAPVESVEEELEPVMSEA